MFMTFTNEQFFSLVLYLRVKLLTYLSGAPYSAIVRVFTIFYWFTEINRIYGRKTKQIYGF